jgi:hypothetical protein
MYYNITQHSKKQAKKLNVQLKPSTNPNKKIDIFDMDGNKISSIGANGMMDYGLYLENYGKEFADKRRKLFYSRFAKDISNVGSNAWWASRILW